MSPATTVAPPRDTLLGANVRRWMARQNLTLVALAEITQLDQRTLRNILRQRSRPHARTLNKLAAGLGVSVDELFLPPQRGPTGLDPTALDRAANPEVARLIAEEPELFAGWSPAEFAELFSQVGVGGPLSPHGARAAAEGIRRRRELWTRAAIVLETDLGDLLRDFIDLLFQRVALGQPCCNAPHGRTCSRSAPD